VAFLLFLFYWFPFFTFLVKKLNRSSPSFRSIVSRGQRENKSSSWQKHFFNRDHLASVKEFLYFQDVAPPSSLPLNIDPTLSPNNSNIAAAVAAAAALRCQLHECKRPSMLLLLLSPVTYVSGRKYAACCMLAVPTLEGHAVERRRPRPTAVRSFPECFPPRSRCRLGASCPFPQV